MARSPEGLADITTLEGIPTLAAYVLTRDGWTAGVFEPKSVLDAPVRRILWSLGLLGLALTLASLALVLAVGRLMSGAMSDLVTAAQRVGRGEVVAPKAFPIHEATAVSQALSAASADRKKA